MKNPAAASANAVVNILNLLVTAVVASVAVVTVVVGNGRSVAG